MSAEKARIRGAVRTDFILSAEIIVITLGIVATAPFATRVAVLVAIALLMTVGVYGLVGAIVKLDDAGLHLSRRAGDGAFARIQRGVGAGILRAAPLLMRGLSIAGTAAMFLVGGGIVVHGIPALDHWIVGLTGGAAALPGIGGALRLAMPFLLNAGVGIVVGAVVLALVSGVRRISAREHGRGLGGIGVRPSDTTGGRSPWRQARVQSRRSSDDCLISLYLRVMRTWHFDCCTPCVRVLIS